MLGPAFGTQWLFKKYTVTEYLPLISEEVCLIQTFPCLPSLYKSDCFELCKRSLLSEQCPQLTKLLSVFPGSLDLTVQLLAVLVQRVILQTAEFGVYSFESVDKSREALSSVAPEDDNMASF